MRDDDLHGDGLLLDGVLFFLAAEKQDCPKDYYSNHGEKHCESNDYIRQFSCKEGRREGMKGDRQGEGGRERERGRERGKEGWRERGEESGERKQTVPLPNCWLNN